MARDRFSDTDATDPQSRTHQRLPEIFLFQFTFSPLIFFSFPDLRLLQVTFLILFKIFANLRQPQVVPNFSFFADLRQPQVGPNRDLGQIRPKF